MAAKKKYYGVRKGKTTGVFINWEECKASVEGFPNAEYKGFTTISEAKEYVNCVVNQHSEEKNDAILGNKKLVAYVDGSYHDGLKRYAFGCVFLLPDGQIYLSFGNGDNEKSLRHRNVTGEMLGAMYAVKTAIYNGYSTIEIYYDYEGIEKWVTKAWKSKNEHTQKYAIAMQEWGKNIEIVFHKVQAHANVEYNELADQTAKRGLIQGEGIPKICRLEEMELWNK